MSSFSQASCSEPLVSQKAVTKTKDEKRKVPFTPPVQVKERRVRTTCFPGDRPMPFRRCRPSSRSPDHRYSSDSSNSSDDENPFISDDEKFMPTIRFQSDPSISPDYIYWINTDGYFRENENFAGHGLVVRDHLGHPIVACSFVGKPISPLYHQLQGVLAAYRVAKKLRIERLQVVFNHCWAHDVLQRFWPEVRRRCSHSPENRCLVCRVCVKQFFGRDTELFWPILQEIAVLSAQFIGYASLAETIPREDNMIADYMAKYGGRFGRQEVFLRPTEFPEELKKLLYQLAEANPDNGVPLDAPPGGFFQCRE